MSGRWSGVLSRQLRGELTFQRADDVAKLPQMISAAAKTQQDLSLRFDECRGKKTRRT